MASGYELAHAGMRDPAPGARHAASASARVEPHAASGDPDLTDNSGIAGGTALLIHDNADDVWLYPPVLGKARRIVSSSRKNSLVGIQFAFAAAKPGRQLKRVEAETTRFARVG